MSTQELYRQVFNAPGGRDVLADLSAYVQRLGVDERGPASLPILRIVTMLNRDPNAAPRPRTTRASGGRIQHG